MQKPKPKHTQTYLYGFVIEEISGRRSSLATRLFLRVASSLLPASESLVGILRNVDGGKGARMPRDIADELSIQPVP